MTIKLAIDVLKIEAEGILKLAERIDDNFDALVDLIYKSKGRVIISGIGKSGLIGQKITATLNSTGTHSVFLHPVEARHGDLGIVSHHDIFLALSNSGETEELNALIPSIRAIGCKIIAFTGNPNSTLALTSDLTINVGVDREACPLGLAPTASTTALLAMGDALAVVLIEKKNFKSSDFKKLHPGGQLGQRLSSKVKDIMIKDDSAPKVLESVSLINAIQKIDDAGIGATLVVRENNYLIGIITDGDIRRWVAKGNDIANYTVSDVMKRTPYTVETQTPAYDALNLMEKHQITILPVTNPVGMVRGIIHLHDILGKGEFKFNGL